MQPTEVTIDRWPFYTSGLYKTDITLYIDSDSHCIIFLPGLSTKSTKLMNVAVTDTCKGKCMHLSLDWRG